MIKNLNCYNCAIISVICYTHLVSCKQAGKSYTVRMNVNACLFY